MAKFLEGVETITDLQPGMRLEGTVTNVTNLAHLLMLVFTKMA